MPRRPATAALLNGIRAVSLGAAGLGAASLVGCAPAATPSQPATPAPVTSTIGPASPSPSPSPTPSASVITTAVTATSARGTARLTISVLTTVEGFDDEIEGAGVAALGSGDADLIWSSVVGQTHEIITKDTLYVQLEPPSGPWVAVPVEEWTPTAAAGRPLRGLGELEDARIDGTEILDGVETTRYTGSLDLVTQGEGLGLNARALQLAAAQPGARVMATVWIDGQGLIVQVMRTLVGGADVAASTVTRLADFGTAAAIRAPIE